MEDTKLKAVHKLLDNIKQSLAHVEDMVRDMESGNLELTDADMDRLQLTPDEHDEEAGSIIEGVFDGYQMIGPDGKKYSVPANYSSKSKLVEGDLLKLTISPDGAFIYKQIKPIDRDRLRGKLVKDKETGEFRVLVDKKLYKVLLASVTYYRGKTGDEAIILTPQGGQSNWAAVDNIIAGATVSDPFAEI
jgi:hypothetical protein